MTPDIKHRSWIVDATEARARRVAECFAVGPPVFEKLQLRGYSQRHERCTRCLTLKRQHAQAPVEESV